MDAREPQKLHSELSGRADCVVVFGSSAGGPGALQEIIPRLPEDIPCGILVVQHMPPGFTRSLARRLDEISKLRVEEASQGIPVTPGKVLVAPGGYHMEVRPGRVIGLNRNPPLHGVRPAVDVTLISAAREFGANVIGVILTGMGTDGLNGIAAVRKRGGKSIAQSEDSCVVYGMPRAIVETGNADSIVHLSVIPQAIQKYIHEMIQKGTTGGRNGLRGI